MISFKFHHGLGDVANFAHMLPLYTKRGYTIGVDCTPDKAPIFEAAGARIVKSGLNHVWGHPPAPGQPTVLDHWSGNKSAYNISRSPLPNIGSYVERWEEYCSVKLNLDAYVTPEIAAKIGSYIDQLPRPLILIHPQGNTGATKKNLPHDTQKELIHYLLDKTDATILLLDWNNRVAKVNNWRVRHLTDDWQALNTIELCQLIKLADLLIGVDSGVYHFARFTDTPVLGCWQEHYPAFFALPRSQTVNLCRQHNLTPYRRLPYQIVDCDMSGAGIGYYAAEMLCSVPGAVFRQALLDKALTFTSPHTSICDRNKTFAAALERLPKTAALVIETGCMRAVEDWSAGMSSYLLGVFLAHQGGKLWSIDLDPRNVAFAQQWCQGLPVEVIRSNSLDWLPTAPLCHLFYADSADVGTPDYQEICLEECKLMEGRTRLILIDDSVWSKGAFQGKGAKAIPYLLGKGWRIVTAGYQVLLERD